MLANEGVRDGLEVYVALIDIICGVFRLAYGDISEVRAFNLGF